MFGGTGDLAYRKLYSSLYHREKIDQFTDPTRIIGVSRREMAREQFQASVREALDKYGEGKDSESVERFLRRIHHVSLDATGEKGWSDLKELLGADERVRAYYLATGPDLFAPIAKRIGEEGLASSALAHHRRKADRP